MQLSHISIAFLKEYFNFQLCHQKTSCYQSNTRTQVHATLGPWDEAQITLTMTAK